MPRSKCSRTKAHCRIGSFSKTKKPCKRDGKSGTFVSAYHSPKKACASAKIGKAYRAKSKSRSPAKKSSKRTRSPAELKQLRDRLRSLEVIRRVQASFRRRSQQRAAAAKAAAAPVRRSGRTTRAPNRL